MLALSKTQQLIIGKVTIALLVVAALLITVASLNKNHIGDEATQAMTEVANEHFERTASIMVDGYEKQKQQYDNLNSHKSHQVYRDEALAHKIDMHRLEMAARGETYSSARSETVIDSVTKLSEDTTKAVVVETTYLTIKGKDTETGYSTKHELTFKTGEGGEFCIVKDSFLEPTGLLPLPTAKKLVVARS